MNDQPRCGAFILMFARDLAWSRAGVEIVTLQTEGGVERQEMKENADPFGLPVLAGDAASRSVGVRREVAIGCE